jgi:hypothetical protein
VVLPASVDADEPARESFAAEADPFQQPHRRSIVRQARRPPVDAGGAR